MFVKSVITVLAHSSISTLKLFAKTIIMMASTDETPKGYLRSVIALFCVVRMHVLSNVRVFIHHI